MEPAGLALPPGFRLARHDAIDSTNAEALRRAAQGEPGGLWVWAKSQRAGRGREGRPWASEGGNLYASLLLRPDISLAAASQLSLLAGVAAYDAVMALAGRSASSTEVDDTDSATAQRSPLPLGEGGGEGQRAVGEALPPHPARRAAPRSSRGQALSPWERAGPAMGGASGPLGLLSAAADGTGSSSAEQPPLPWEEGGGEGQRAVGEALPPQPARRAAPASWERAGPAAGAGCASRADATATAALVLKWPNDLLAGNAKLGGILLESVSGIAGEPAAVVIGVGLNLAHAPQDLGRPATSLAALGLSAMPADAMAAEAMAALASSMAAWLAVWDHGRGFPLIREAWLARSQPVGAAITVHQGVSLIAGRYLGIDDAGALLLRTEDGQARRIMAGDVSIGADAQGA